MSLGRDSKALEGDFDGMPAAHSPRPGSLTAGLVLAPPRNRSDLYVSRTSKRHQQSLQTKALKVHVVFIPVTRDQLQPALVEGRGDIAAANLTRTTQIETVEFSDPLMTGIQELVVTGASEPIASLDELAGKEVHVRKSSSYYRTGLPQRTVQTSRKTSSSYAGREVLDEVSRDDERRAEGITA